MKPLTAIMCSFFWATICEGKATCELVGSISGTLHLEMKDNDTLIVKGTIHNISQGEHAIHVHETGSTGGQCAEAGAHYNPRNSTHGGKDDKLRHEGDWGNFIVKNTTQDIKISDSVAKLTGETSILNRAIVIHAGSDDLGKGENPGSKMHGNAGSRIGCCVIKSQ